MVGCENLGAQTMSHQITLLRAGFKPYGVGLVGLRRDSSEKALQQNKFGPIWVLFGERRFAARVGHTPHGLKSGAGYRSQIA
jgi:hypothetical protein